MKNPNIFLFFILLVSKIFGQPGNLDRVKQNDSIYNSSKIIFYGEVMYSSTKFVNASTGTTQTSNMARSFKLSFRKGDGELSKLGRRGKNLKMAMKEDAQALAEIDKAYKVHFRRKRINNSLEYVSYVVAIGSLVPFFIGIDADKEKVNTLSVGGGVGVILSWAGVYYFRHATDKHMDEFKACLERSVDIYNDNLKKRIK